MAAQHQRRPGDKAPTDKDPAARAREARARESAEKQAQDRLQQGADIDAESAQHLAGQMGNAALGALVGGPEAEQLEEEEQEQSGEEGLEEDQAEESAREGSLPAFGAGGGGGAASPPWEMGRVFGGEDDEDAGEGPRRRWIPPEIPPDPDEEDPFELEDTAPEADPDDPEDALRAAARQEAEEVLGALPWRGTPLNRGMRAPQRSMRPLLEPEDVVDTGDVPLGRLRSGVRFLGEACRAHSTSAAIARLTEASGSLTLLREGGLAGATAMTAALAEAALEGLGGEDSAWGRALDVACDPRARPLAEQAASVLEEGDLAAPRLFQQAMGRVDPAEVFSPTDTLAAEACTRALARAAALQPLPLLGSFTEEAPLAEELDAVDALLAAFTATAPEAEPEAALRDDLDRALVAMGRAQVELTAAALAATAWVDPGAAWSVLVEADGTLREAARALVEAGESFLDAEAPSREARIAAAALARSQLEACGDARDLALRRLASGVAGGDSRAPEALPAQEARLVEAALRAWEGGSTARATAVLSRLEQGALGRAASLLRLAQARATDDPAVDPLAATILEGAVDADAPFAAVAAALALAQFAGTAREALDTLRLTGAWLRSAGHVGALQLLKAAWVEERVRRAREADDFAATSC